MAPETESAETKKLANTIALGGAKRPKLIKMIVSQKMRTASNGIETEAMLCSYINHRVWPRPIVMPNAWACIDRCASFFGESPWILSNRTSDALEDASDWKGPAGL